MRPVPWLIAVLIVALLFAGGIEVSDLLFKRPKPVVEQPDGPISRGTCDVLGFIDSKPSELRCAWQGFIWTCDSRAGYMECIRDNPMPPEKL